MKVNVLTIRKMLVLLSEKTGSTLDFTGLQAITEHIGFQNSNYLYKKMHLAIQNKNGRDTLGLSRYHLNAIAKFIGFKTFHELEESLQTNLSEQLQSIAGNYYCYVRANVADATVLRSPVRISVKNSKLEFELKGPSITYSGEVLLRKGCLFILMNSKAGKSFHHIYKIGERHRPEVLQGVFSGVSTAFDPIGGRTVLVRQNDDFKGLTNNKSAVSVLKKSRQPEERVLGAYYSDYRNNNVAPLKSATFDIDDLRI